MKTYEEHKCKSCGQIFEVRTDVADTLYGEYCPTCFLNNVIEDIYGGLRRKTDKEKVRDLSYKDELQEVTHRGKHRVEINGTSYRRKRQIAYDMTDQWSE
jgi:predicted  nucleic acid-binding Zn-ribbon protein